MEAKFTTNPSIRSDTPGGVESIDTDLLMLTKTCGSGLGPGPKALDLRLDGRLSKKIQQKKFQGNLGETLSLQLGDGAPARNVLLVGLGSPAKIDYTGRREVIQLAVERAISMRCSKLSISIDKDRLTAPSLNLTGMACEIRKFVEDKLEEIASTKPGILEVELVCTPQAERFLKKGLLIKRRGKRVSSDASSDSKPSK